MLSRIMWVGLAGLALIAGIIYQSGGAIHVIGHSSGHGDSAIAQVVERGVADHMTVVNVDGQQVEVSPQTKQELAGAIGDLASAKAELMILRARDGDPKAIAEAEQRSNQAHARVEQIRDQIHAQEDAGAGSRDAIRTQVHNSVRDTVREAIRGRG